MEKGFTLIELLVVMSVIAILSAVLFLARGEGELRLRIQRSAFALAKNIREMQEIAMGAQELDCGGKTTYSAGLYFHKVALPDSYLLFADCNENRYKDVDDKILKEVKLEKGVIIYSLSSSPLNIVFSPPEPFTYLNMVKEEGEESIVLSSESDPEESVRQKRIKLNTAGRIEIE